MYNQQRSAALYGDGFFDGRDDAHSILGDDLNHECRLTGQEPCLDLLDTIVDEVDAFLFGNVLWFDPLSTFLLRVSIVL